MFRFIFLTGKSDLSVDGDLHDVPTFEDSGHEESGTFPIG